MQTGTTKPSSPVAGANAREEMEQLVGRLASLFTDRNLAPRAIHGTSHDTAGAAPNQQHVSTEPLLPVESLLHAEILPPMSERRTFADPVPAFNPKNPYPTQSQLDLWHSQKTDMTFKNACGTHSAINLIMREEGNRTLLDNGSAQMRHFNNVVTGDLLLFNVPRQARDNDLCFEFTDLFRQCLEVTDEKEELQLYEAIFNLRRNHGEPLNGFAVDYCTAVKNFNCISWAKVPSSNDVHWLIQNLNLNAHPMLDIYVKLTAAKEGGSSITDIMRIIAKYPNIMAITLLEKQLSGTRPIQYRVFLACCDSDVETMGSKVSSSNQENGSFFYNSHQVLTSFKVASR
jgi:hypothetical protein